MDLMREKNLGCSSDKGGSWQRDLDSNRHCEGAVARNIRRSLCYTPFLKSCIKTNCKTRHIQIKMEKEKEISFISDLAK